MPNTAAPAASSHNATCRSFLRIAVEENLAEEYLAWEDRTPEQRDEYAAELDRRVAVEIDADDRCYCDEEI